MDKQPAVYMLSNRPGGVIYTGVTSDLIKRIHQHRTHAVPGFTKRYNATKLVWYELCLDIGCAIEREKQIKNWQRAWKIKQIEVTNPLWHDLYDSIVG